jgi:trans-2,3-dihydro-3-hydroxyanthranilate isomerase
MRRVDDTTLHARVFLPESGIAEDPGTGSAAGAIGVLARRLWSTSADVVIRQGDEMGRPCRIEVHAEDGDVRVGGRVAACAEGLFTL